MRERERERRKTHLGLCSLVQCVPAETDRALCGRHLQHPCNTRKTRSPSVALRSPEARSRTMTMTQILPHIRISRCN